MSVLAYQIHKWCAILTHTIDFSRFIYSVALRHHHRRHHHPKQLPKSSADIQSVKCDVLKLVSNAREHVWSRYIKYIPGWEKWMDGRQRKTIQSSIIKEGFQENCFSLFHSLHLHFPFQRSFIRVRARRWANKHTHTHVMAMNERRSCDKRKTLGFSKAEQFVSHRWNDVNVKWVDVVFIIVFCLRVWVFVHSKECERKNHKLLLETESSSETRKTPSPCRCQFSFNNKCVDLLIPFWID